jgi:hypothetical protein
MRLAGFFPSIPRPVNFEMIFAPVDGQWRLFGLSVALGQAGPAAPTPPAASTPPAPPSAAAPKAAPGAQVKPAPAAAATPAAPAR